MLRELVSFKVEAGATYTGYSKANSAKQALAIGNPVLKLIEPALFGAKIQGFVIENASSDAFLMFAPSTDISSLNLGWQAGKVSDQDGEFILSSIALYASTDAQAILNESVRPLAKVKDLADLDIESNAQGLALSLPGFFSSSSLDTEQAYTLALEVNPLYLAERGFVEYLAETAVARLMPSQLSTSIKSAMVYSGFENSFEVQILENNRPVDLSSFTEFTLSNLSSVVTMTGNAGAISFGKEQGKLIFKLSDLALDAGVYETRLVGVSPEFPEGVVLWDDGLKASVTVRVLA